MGAPVLEAPAASEDKDFAINLAAFETQNKFIKELGKKFAKGIEGGAAYNGKDLLTSMVLSEWFRADEVENVDVRDRLVSDLGTRRLLTPEELEKKSRSLLGWKWRATNFPKENPLNFDSENSYLSKLYNIYYGGIDSDGITERSSALTALMLNVAEKQALEMTCPAVMVDFERVEGTRLLFNGIDPSTTPETEKSENTIKAVIVNLHNRLLGISHDITDPEIDLTYQLLVDVWQVRKTLIAEKNNDNVALRPDEDCDYYLDEHSEEGGIGSRGNDPSGMKSSWMSVLAYLMTDFNFLHE